MNVQRSVAAATLAVTALATAGLVGTPVRAQTARPPGRGLTGTITRVNLGSIVVKTSTGSVTVKLTSSTVYSKVEAGKVSDLKTGEFVTIVAASGTTVSSVNVGTRFGRGFPGRRPGTTRRPGTGTFARRGFGGGTITTIAKGKLTLRSFTGKSTTYTLAKNVKVTKTARSTFSALHPGLTVRIGAPPGSTTAFSVTIE